MNNFASFSEDALPRSIPLPSVDPRTLSLKANAAVPSVPELSMLNCEPPVEQPLPSAPKPTSYSAWKSEQMNGWIGSQPQSDKDRPVQIRKTVSFDTPLARVDHPALCGNTTRAAAVTNRDDGRPKLCGQLELSAFEPPLQNQQTIVTGLCSNMLKTNIVPISHIQQLRQEMVDRVNLGFVQSTAVQQDVPVKSPNQLCASDMVTLGSNRKDEDRANANCPDFLPIVIELIRMLGDKNNIIAFKENPNPEPSASEATAMISLTQKENTIPATSEPTVKDLHELILKQQEEISLLREQVNQLMQIQETTHQHPPQNHQSQPTPAYPDDELVLGEEASTLPNQHQTPRPHQFQRRHHNSPADWKFYGNTLEQVAQILQNAPPTRSSPPQTNNHHQQVEKLIQVHLHGMHFSDVNLSATQRVTFTPNPTADNTETPKQTQRPMMRNGSSHPSLSDRSMAMNHLALKYLPEHQNNAYQIQPAGDRHHSPAAGNENIAPATTRRSKSPEMSAMTLDYFQKYGLLENKRLFDD